MMMMMMMINIPARRTCARHDSMTTPAAGCAPAQTARRAWSGNPRPPDTTPAVPGTTACAGAWALEDCACGFPARAHARSHARTHAHTHAESANSRPAYTRARPRSPDTTHRPCTHLHGRNAVRRGISELRLRRRHGGAEIDSFPSSTRENDLTKKFPFSSL